MPLPQSVLDRLTARQHPNGPAPKRGDTIFTGTDYPRDWTDFIGQTDTKARLQAQIASATARGTRIDHTLFASGLHGIGKTTLAYLLAYKMGVGVTAVSGAVSVDQARDVLRQMTDRDILFWDEFHLAVTGSRTRADWTLPFLTDGDLVTASGAEKMPNVAVVAATTDAGRLPLTVLSRFMCVPKLVPYTPAEGAVIAQRLSERMGIPILPDEAPRIAQAAACNPRAMRVILTAVRDVSYSPEAYSFEKALEWAGFTYDGLTSVAQDMLLLLLDAPDHTLGLEQIQMQLNEPGPVKHHEQLLLQRALLSVSGRGRTLTDAGVERAARLLEER